MRGATNGFCKLYNKQLISIHAPLCGGRPKYVKIHFTEITFQSTPPCAGGDAESALKYNFINNFNPRPPVRGATPAPKFRLSAGNEFQSTPPCAGGDMQMQLVWVKNNLFQSTPPCAGGDLTISRPPVAKELFQSTPPCAGGDWSEFHKLGADKRFQSTPPCAGGDIAGLAGIVKL